MRNRREVENTPPYVQQERLSNSMLSKKKSSHKPPSHHSSHFSAFNQAAKLQQDYSPASHFANDITTVTKQKKKYVLVPEQLVINNPEIFQDNYEPKSTSSRNFYIKSPNNHLITPGKSLSYKNQDSYKKLALTRKYNSPSKSSEQLLNEINSQMSPKQQQQQQQTASGLMHYKDVIMSQNMTPRTKLKEEIYAKYNSSNSPNNMFASGQTINNNNNKSSVNSISQNGWKFTVQVEPDPDAKSSSNYLSLSQSMNNSKIKLAIPEMQNNSNQMVQKQLTPQQITLQILPSPQNNPQQGPMLQILQQNPMQQFPQPLEPQQQLNVPINAITYSIDHTPQYGKKFAYNQQLQMPEPYNSEDKEFMKDTTDEILCEFRQLIQEQSVNQQIQLENEVQAAKYKLNNSPFRAINDNNANNNSKSPIRNINEGQKTVPIKPKRAQLAYQPIIQNQKETVKKSMSPNNRNTQQSDIQNTQGNLINTSYFGPQFNNNNDSRQNSRQNLLRVPLEISPPVYLSKQTNGQKTTDYLNLKNEQQYEQATDEERRKQLQQWNYTPEKPQQAHLVHFKRPHEIINFLQQLLDKVTSESQFTFHFNAHNFLYYENQNTFMFADPETNENRYRVYVPCIEFSKILFLPKFSQVSLLLLHYNKTEAFDGSIQADYILLYHKYSQFYDFIIDKIKNFDKLTQKVSPNDMFYFLDGHCRQFESQSKYSQEIKANQTYVNQNTQQSFGEFNQYGAGGQNNYNDQYYQSPFKRSPNMSNFNLNDQQQQARFSTPQQQHQQSTQFNQASNMSTNAYQTRGGDSPSRVGPQGQLNYMNNNLQQQQPRFMDQGVQYSTQSLQKGRFPVGILVNQNQQSPTRSNRGDDLGIRGDSTQMAQIQLGGGQYGQQQQQGTQENSQWYQRDQDIQNQIQQPESPFRNQSQNQNYKSVINQSGDIGQGISQRSPGFNNGNPMQIVTGNKLIQNGHQQGTNEKVSPSLVRFRDDVSEFSITDQSYSQMLNSNRGGTSNKTEFNPGEQYSPIGQQNQQMNRGGRFGGEVTKTEGGGIGQRGQNMMYNNAGSNSKQSMGMGGSWVGQSVPNLPYNDNNQYQQNQNLQNQPFNNRPQNQGDFQPQDTFRQGSNSPIRQPGGSGSPPRGQQQGGGGFSPPRVQQQGGGFNPNITQLRPDINQNPSNVGQVQQRQTDQNQNQNIANRSTFSPLRDNSGESRTINDQQQNQRFGLGYGQGRPPRLSISQRGGRGGAQLQSRQGTRGPQQSRLNTQSQTQLGTNQIGQIGYQGQQQNNDFSQQSMLMESKILDQGLDEQGMSQVNLVTENLTNPLMNTQQGGGTSRTQQKTKSYVNMASKVDSEGQPKYITTVQSKKGKDTLVRSSTYYQRQQNQLSEMRNQYDKSKLVLVNGLNVLKHGTRDFFGPKKTVIRWSSDLEYFGWGPTLMQSIAAMIKSTQQSQSEIKPTQTHTTITKQQTIQKSQDDKQKQQTLINKNDKVFQMNDIINLFDGMKTENFKKFKPKGGQEILCFSIALKSRTIDIICNNAQDKERYFSALYNIYNMRRLFEFDENGMVTLQKKVAPEPLQLESPTSIKKSRIQAI